MQNAWSLGPTKILIINVLKNAYLSLEDGCFQQAIIIRFCVLLGNDITSQNSRVKLVGLFCYLLDVPTRNISGKHLMLFTNKLNKGIITILSIIIMKNESHCIQVVQIKYD